MKKLLTIALSALTISAHANEHYINEIGTYSYSNSTFELPIYSNGQAQSSRWTDLVINPIETEHSNGILGDAKILVADPIHTGRDHGDRMLSVIERVAPKAHIERSDTLNSVTGIGDKFDDDTYVMDSIASDSFDIINMSYSVNITNRNLANQYNMRLRDFANNNKNTLFVTSAGNGQKTDMHNDQTITILADHNPDQILIVTGVNGGSTARTMTEAERMISAPYAWGNSQGTSQGAALVSGSVALLMDKFGISSRDAAKTLLDTAIDHGATGVDTTYGVGLLNLAGALSPIGSIR